jgi:hypothetical protein
MPCHAMPRAPTPQTLIDDACVFRFNTLGEKNKGCETKGGPNSQYCKESCTPVYGGGTVYLCMYCRLPVLYMDKALAWLWRLHRVSSW